MIFRRRKSNGDIPPSEKRQLAQVKRRLDRVEARVVLVETQLKVIRRDTK